MLYYGKVLHRSSIRALTIKQAPHVSNSTSVLNNSISNTSNIESVEDLPNLKSMGTVKMEAVGVPPSAMSIGVPPSLPVYFRRRTLLAIQANHKHISLSNNTIQLFKRLFYGNFVSRYQSLIGTEPFSLMVTASPLTVLPSIFKNTTSKSFASISLDGISDWAILKPDALHIYAGPSLNIDMFRLPRQISRQLAKRLDTSTKSLTGLFHWARPGYTFVSGRGNIGISGNGVVYSVQIAEGEELSINKNNLVALSVNGPHDIQNCVIKYTYPVSDKVKEIVTTEIAPPRMAQIRNWHDFVINSKYYAWKVSKFFQKFRNQLLPKLLVGNMDFVRVIGPRSVLLQSGSPQQSFERTFHLPGLNSSNLVGVETPKLPVSTERAPADYLNIVSFDAEGKPSIRSTNDFKDTVKDLERHRS